MDKPNSKKRYEVFVMDDANAESNFYGVVKLLSLSPDVLTIEDSRGEIRTYKGPFNIELCIESLKINIREQ